MKREGSVLVIFWIFVWLGGDGVGAASSGITVTGVKCGVKTCKLSEFCSNFDNTCQSCSDVCDIGHHNYDEPLCEKECQDYLHDMRYVRKQNSNMDDGELKATVAKLSRMVTVNTTLVVLMLITLVSFLCFQLYRWKVKKNITFASLKKKLFGRGQTNNEHNVTTKVNNLPGGDGNKKQPDLRLEMPTSGSQSDHSPVTMTTTISRRPAEDSTLDYAYDNPAMSTPR